MDYPITLESDAWEAFRSIDFADLNGDGNSDVTIKCNDGGSELLMVWFWDTESNQFVYQPLDATILLSEQQGGEHIPSDQQILWDFLWNAADGSGRIAMSDLIKYIKDNQEAASVFRRSFDSAVEGEFSKRVKSKNVARYSRVRLKHRLIVSAVAGILAILIRMLSTLHNGVESGASLEASLGVFFVVMVVEALIHFWKFVFKTTCYILDQQGGG